MLVLPICLRPTLGLQITLNCGRGKPSSHCHTGLNVGQMHIPCQLPPQRPRGLPTPPPSRIPPASKLHARERTATTRLNETISRLFNSYSRSGFHYEKGENEASRQSCTSSHT